MLNRLRVGIIALQHLLICNTRNYFILLRWCLHPFRTDGKLFNLSRLWAISKVQLQLIQELLYADDCVLCASSEADLQAITSSIACAATRFGLTINVSKREVLYQPTPGALSQPVTIIIDGAEVKQTNKFCCLGSVLSDNAVIDDEIQCRIQKAVSSLLSLALVLGLQLSSRTNFESLALALKVKSLNLALALALSKSLWPWPNRSLALQDL